MNHDNDHIPCFDNCAEEREWLAQERAMTGERLHQHAAAGDTRSGGYRLLSRALRTPPPSGLSADFAAQVSATIALRTPTLAFERVLTITLVSLLLLSAATVTLIYGHAWWPSFKVLLPAPPASQWWLVLSSCLGFSWLIGAWQTGGTTPRR